MFFSIFKLSSLRSPRWTWGSGCFSLKLLSWCMWATCLSPVAFGDLSHECWYLSSWGAAGPRKMGAQQKPGWKVVSRKGFNNKQALTNWGFCWAAPFSTWGIQKAPTRPKTRRRFDVQISTLHLWGNATQPEIITKYIHQLPLLHKWRVKH